MCSQEPVPGIYFYQAGYNSSQWLETRFFGRQTRKSCNYTSQKTSSTFFYAHVVDVFWTRVLSKGSNVHDIAFVVQDEKNIRGIMSACTHCLYIPHRNFLLWLCVYEEVSDLLSVLFNTCHVKWSNAQFISPVLHQTKNLRGGDLFRLPFRVYFALGVFVLVQWLHFYSSFYYNCLPTGSWVSNRIYMPCTSGGNINCGYVFYFACYGEC